MAAIVIEGCVPGGTGSRTTSITSTPFAAHLRLMPARPMFDAVSAWCMIEICSGLPISSFVRTKVHPSCNGVNRFVEDSALAMPLLQSDWLEPPGVKQDGGSWAEARNGPANPKAAIIARYLTSVRAIGRLINLTE